MGKLHADSTAPLISEFIDDFKPKTHTTQIVDAGIQIFIDAEAQIINRMAK